VPLTASNGDPPHCGRLDEVEQRMKKVEQHEDDLR
jgi:hypothetical protein